MNATDAFVSVQESPGPVDAKDDRPPRFPGSRASLLLIPDRGLPVQVVVGTIHRSAARLLSLRRDRQRRKRQDYERGLGHR